LRTTFFFGASESVVSSTLSASGTTLVELDGVSDVVVRSVLAGVVVRSVLAGVVVSVASTDFPFARGVLALVSDSSVSTFGRM
jgi:hypothetical protein